MENLYKLHKKRTKQNNYLAKQRKPDNFFAKKHKLIVFGIPVCYSETTI